MGMHGWSWFGSAVAQHDGPWSCCEFSGHFVPTRSSTGGGERVKKSELGLLGSLVSGYFYIQVRRSVLV